MVRPRAATFRPSHVGFHRSMTNENKVMWGIAQRRLVARGPIVARLFQGGALALLRDQALFHVTARPGSAQDGSGKADRQAIGFGQGPGQFDQDDVRFRRQDLRREHFAGCEFLRLARGSLLPLRCKAPLQPERRRQPDRCAGTRPENAPRSPARMTGFDAAKHPSAKIRQTCLAHVTAPRQRESPGRSFGNPPQFRTIANRFNRLKRNDSGPPTTWNCAVVKADSTRRGVP